MRGINDACIDLIYLDPPFNSNADYAAPIGSKSAGAEFKDTWYLSDIKEQWIEQIEEEHPHLYRVLLATPTNNLKSYLAYMSIRVLEMRRILKPDGSIWLHCDDSAGFYVKAMMDAIFGPKNCRNTVFWKRTTSDAKGSQHDPRSYGRITDFLFHYSVGDKFTFNGPYKKASKEVLAKKFPHVDSDGRRYNTSTPLFRAPTAGDRPNLCYTYKGVSNPHPSGWRVKKEKLIALDQAGEIIWRKGKRPQRKKYQDTYKGIPLGNIWTDISNELGKKRTDYPTQKPAKLLERIIEVSSNEGDIVFDPFCGCATTMVVADRLKRQWAGIDCGEKAVEFVKNRIHEDQGLFANITNRTDLLQRTDIGPPPDRKKLKKVLYGDQSGNCKGCDTHFPDPAHLEMDHIVSKDEGGGDYAANFQLLCSRCNRVKGNRGMDYLMSKLNMNRQLRVRSKGKRT